MTAKVKDKSNTGFRNGNLFCFNCGSSFDMQLPQPVDFASIMMKSFSKAHINCPKTWAEPVAEINGKSEKENMNWWLTKGEHGISSKNMYAVLSSGIITKKLQTPSDPDDFSRCYKLLKAVPQFKTKLHLMKDVSSSWSNLVDNWDKLTEMYEQNVKEEWKNYNKIGMYEFMKELGC